MVAVYRVPVPSSLPLPLRLTLCPLLLAAPTPPEGRRLLVPRAFARARASALSRSRVLEVVLSSSLLLAFAPSRTRRARSAASSASSPLSEPLSVCSDTTVLVSEGSGHFVVEAKCEPASDASLGAPHLEVDAKCELVVEASWDSVSEVSEVSAAAGHLDVEAK